MKLLFDHNLPPLLVSRLNPGIEFPKIDEVDRSYLRVPAKPFKKGGPFVRLTEMVSCSG